MRAELVHRTRIGYHVAEKDSTYSNKAEIQNSSSGNTPDLPLKRVEMTEQGREREGRTYDVTDGERIRNGLSPFFNPLFSYNIQKLS